MRINFFINPGLTILLFIISPCLSLFAQDSVLLLNGDLLQGKITADQGDFYSFQWIRKQKMDEVALEKLDIFSVIVEGKAEMIIYKMDSALGNDFTIQQMRNFWEGEHQARLQYKPVLPLLGGGIVGAFSPFYGFWGLALSPVYLGVIAIKKPIPPDNMPIPVKVTDEGFYKLGYGYAARRKKVQRTALTTFGSLVVVWVISVATGGLK